MKPYSGCCFGQDFDVLISKQKHIKILQGWELCGDLSSSLRSHFSCTYIVSYFLTCTLLFGSWSITNNPYDNKFMVGHSSEDCPLISLKSPSVIVWETAHRLKGKGEVSKHFLFIYRFEHIVSAFSIWNVDLTFWLSIIFN